MTRRGAIAGALLSAALLSGCASLAERNAKFAELRAERNRELRERQVREQQEAALRQQALELSVPSCSDESECAAMWDAAELWIADNAGMRIATSTRNVIETYPSNSLRLAARATRRAQGDGEYRIEVAIGCGNHVFSTAFCSRDPYEATMDFNREVSRAAR